jgi:hypothetical protein
VHRHRPWCASARSATARTRRPSCSVALTSATPGHGSLARTVRTVAACVQCRCRISIASRKSVRRPCAIDGVSSAASCCNGRRPPAASTIPTSSRRAHTAGSGRSPRDLGRTKATGCSGRTNGSGRSRPSRILGAAAGSSSSNGGSRRGAGRIRTHIPRVAVVGSTRAASPITTIAGRLDLRTTADRAGSAQGRVRRRDGWSHRSVATPT